MQVKTPWFGGPSNTRAYGGRIKRKGWDSEGEVQEVPNGNSVCQRRFGEPEESIIIIQTVKAPLYFKSSNTLGQLSVRQKDKIQKKKVVGPVCHIQCETCEGHVCWKNKQIFKGKILRT